MHELTLHAALRRARQHIDATDAAVLLAHVTGMNRAALIARSDHPLDEHTATRFAALVERRARGEPVAHLTGAREFWSLPLAITPDVLIPRPETELLVERALAWLAPEAHTHIADLGTGSGAIALALAKERPDTVIVATDVSEAGLAVARANAVTLGLREIDWRMGAWCAAFAPDERFDLIVSNPPYVASGDAAFRSGDTAHEPRLALDGGADGLDAMRIIADEARAHLVEGGLLLLEHGFDQEDALTQLLTGYGYTEIRCFRDLAGLPRVTQARWPGNPDER